ncbi:MAG TPA: YdcF family protein [Candidatus Saccharimonadales bacterium]|nr:YdcF family protein [Candidatus Saccharimonadales bacterium]
MSKTAENLNLVAGYLARRDIPNLEAGTVSADILVLLGSSLIEPIHVAASALKKGVARHLLVSGGIGHSTQGFRDMVNNHPTYSTVSTAERAEADIIHDILTQHLGVRPEQITVENKSTNCGTNAEESRRVIDVLGRTGQSLLLVQDPTMQQRSQACFERAWNDMPDAKIMSFAPFIPVVQSNDEGYIITGSAEKVWPFERFASLVLGEIPRLRDDENGYGPKGLNYIDHVEIPVEILAAHAELVVEFPELVRMAA